MACSEPLTLALLSFGKLLMFLDLDSKRWPMQKPIAKHPNIQNFIPRHQKFRHIVSRRVPHRR